MGWTNAFLGDFIRVLDFQVAAQQDGRSNEIHSWGFIYRQTFVSRVQYRLGYLNDDACSLNIDVMSVSVQRPLKNDSFSYVSYVMPTAQYVLEDPICYMLPRWR